MERKISLLTSVVAMDTV